MSFGDTIAALLGQYVQVGTIAGTFIGILTESGSDYICMESSQGSFYIPLSQIVWICRVSGRNSFTQVYESRDYRVRLKFPADWSKLQGYADRYGGTGGFFQAAAAGRPGTTIDDAAIAEAHHALAPYGSTPVIEKGRLHGAEARRIWPSNDQFAEMEGQSALFVAYPAPVRLGETDYSYFVLFADRHHLETIGNTLRFMV